MVLTDVLPAEFDEETEVTRRILERVPDGKSAWQPHERSMTLGRLATHVAEIPAWAARVLAGDEYDVAPAGAPPFRPRTLGSTAEILALFDGNVADARRALAAAGEADLARTWTFKRGGQIVWTKPKHYVLRRMAFSHLVHHRAQLGVYLRLQGVPIPGVYGPSADDRQGWA